MHISVAYAEPNAQYWIELNLEEGATVASAIEHSGILRRFPEIDLMTQKIGVFGKVVKPEAVLQEGDRVEIYRGITADPETVPRNDGEEEGDA